MKNYLRRILHMWRRFVDMLVGANVAEWNRLLRAGRIDIGPRSYGIPIVKTYMHDSTRLVVGSYSALSETAIVMLGGNHHHEHVTTYPLRIALGMPGAGQDGIPIPSADTRIGSDVWLTQRTFVRSGITVGDGAIVASGAVLTKDVPPYAIVGGNPARVLRYRFSEQQIAALLDIRWWDWPEAEVRRATPLLASDDIDTFIDYARRRFPGGPGSEPADVPAPHDAFTAAPAGEAIRTTADAEHV